MCKLGSRKALEKVPAFQCMWDRKTCILHLLSFGIYHTFNTYYYLLDLNFCSYYLDFQLLAFVNVAEVNSGVEVPRALAFSSLVNVSRCRTSGSDSDSIF